MVLNKYYFFIIYCNIFSLINTTKHVIFGLLSTNNLLGTKGVVVTGSSVVGGVVSTGVVVSPCVVVSTGVGEWVIGVVVTKGLVWLL